MQNKILILDSDPKVLQLIEQMLEEVVQAGAELFLTRRAGDALIILKRECPQLIFVDQALMGQEKGMWHQTGVHVVFTGDAAIAGEDCLVKPFNASQVLERCHRYLNQEAVRPMPPM